MSTNKKKQEKQKREDFHQNSHRAFEAIDRDSRKKKPTSSSPSTNLLADIHYAIMAAWPKFCTP
jgi:hypothetical protein